MKKNFMFVLFFCIFLSKNFSKDIVEGYWKSYDKKNVSGYWYIYEKDGLLFGRCLLAADLPVDATLYRCKRNYKNHPMMNKNFPNLYRADIPLIFNVQKKADGIWKGGNIIDARNGHLYTCEISYKKADGKKLSEDVLAVRGQIAPGLGMTLYWKKSNAREINDAIKKTAETIGGDFAKNNIEYFLIKE